MKSLVLALVSALSAQQPAPQQPAVQSQPVARVQITPSAAAIKVGDTIRLAAVAFDSNGARLDSVRLFWFMSGGRFEGRVDSTGLVTAGATGILNVTAAAMVPGRTGKPTLGFAQVSVLPLPAARVAVSPQPSRALAGTSRALAAYAVSSGGDRRYDQVTWSSSRPLVVEVSNAGLLTARVPGTATVTASAGGATQSWRVTVVPNPVARVGLAPADTQVRTGDVIRFRFSATTAARRPVAEAHPEWAVAPVGEGTATIDGEGVFVANEPGTYRVLATLGARTAAAVVRVDARSITRQISIVGRLPLKIDGAELWLHPDGKHAYMSTIGDRIYAIDISDPAKPALTDSVVVDARVVNDVMTTEDGKFGVMTREGASSRKNGIVILSFEDPAHPKPIAEFTETVTGGVHSTYVYRGYIYLTDDATGSMRVIDIRDPYHPKQVARWQVERPEAGRTLHDIDIRDGLATLSYWNDGLVILDVGNGIKGGSPENPQLVLQFKYDLNALYRRVEQAGGPGFIRGTHTSWRVGNRYVFVGDEVFPARQQGGGPGVIGLGRAYGRLHVIDISDTSTVREVAWFEPEDGGAHNVWVAGDTLYLGDYQGGLRILDISGELKGDLLAQGREYAHVHTGDPSGKTPNMANAWGAIYRDGLIYVPDINSGLWVVRLEPTQTAIP